MMGGKRDGSVDRICQNMPISAKPFGTLPSGEEVTLYTITAADGAAVDIMTYGGVSRL